MNPIIDTAKGSCCPECFCYFTEDGATVYQHGELVVCKNCASEYLDLGKSTYPLLVGKGTYIEVKISKLDVLNF